MSFDVGAEAYDRFMGRYSAPLALGFVDFADVQTGQTALNVGCGPGAVTAELVRRLGPDAPFTLAAHAWAARGHAPRADPSRDRG